MSQAGRDTARQVTPIVLGASALVLTMGFLLEVAESTIRTKSWGPFAALVAALGAGTLTAFVTRIMMGHAGAGMPAAASRASSLQDEHMKSRIAPIIVGAGTIGIAILAAAVLVLIYLASWTSIPIGGAVLTSIGQKLDTVVLGVFSSVLSVFAAWVGTVLAYYYSNENFRIASESTQKLVGGRPPDDEPITSPTRMISFEKMTRHDLPGELPPEDKDLTPAQRAEKVKIDDIYGKFNATVTRLPILDAERRVLFVIRKKLLDIGYEPPKTADAAAAPPPPNPAKRFVTVGDYLNFDQNRADALNFQFLHGRATVAGGRQVLAIYDTLDIFITDHGKPHEPVKGWATDDTLR